MLLAQAVLRVIELTSNSTTESICHHVLGKDYIKFSYMFSNRFVFKQY